MHLTNQRSVIQYLYCNFMGEEGKNGSLGGSSCIILVLHTSKHTHTHTHALFSLNTPFNTPMKSWMNVCCLGSINVWAARSFQNQVVRSCILTDNAGVPHQQETTLPHPLLFNFPVQDYLLWDNIYEWRSTDQGRVKIIGETSALAWRGFTMEEALIY